MGKWDLRNNNGSLTVEVVVCLGLLGVFACGIFMVLWGNQTVLIATQLHAKHLWLATASMEAAQAQADWDFNSLDNSNNSTSDSVELTTVKLLTDYAKKIIVDSHPAQAEFSRFGTVLEAVVINNVGAEGRDTCALEFAGDWSAPRLAGSLSLSANNPGTDIDVLAGKAFVATNGTTQSLPDLYIADVMSVSSPGLLGSLNTGPGLQALQVVGRYVYAANTSVNGQLQVIDISNPSAPVLMNNKQMPGVSGVTGVGKSIYYYNRKVLVGLAKTTGAELHMWDVSTSISPVWLGSYETNTSINDIYVNGNIAYLTLAEGKQLLMVDITNPAHMVELGNFVPSGSTVQSGQSLAVLGTQAVLGRAAGLPAAGYKELSVLDVSHPTAISQAVAADANISFYALFIRNGLLFASTNDAGGEFKIYDMAHNLNPVSAVHTAGQITGLDCEGEVFYAAQNSQPQLQIITH